MVDGGDRVWGFLSGAVEETHPEHTVTVGANTGRDSAGGTVWKELEEEQWTIASINFTSETGGRIRLEMSFDRDFVTIDAVMAWAKAVWDGAASKDFPQTGWKY